MTIAAELQTKVPATPSDWIDWADIEARVFRGDINSEIVCGAVKRLSEIVLNRHYSYINQPSTREDLISVGVLKALQLLDGGRFDRNITSLKNYLYTGIRNEMTNHLYRSRRELSSDDDSLALHGGKTEGGRRGETITVRFEEVAELFTEFETCYAKYLPHILLYLRDMGFNVVRIPPQIVDSVDRRPINEKILERLACLMIWKKLDDCLW